MLRTDALEYELPPELIATRPSPARDAARMMVLDRTGCIIAHTSVRELPDFLRPGDALIVNNSRVVPARFVARRLDTGAHIEGLFLHLAGQPDLAISLLRPGLRVRPGQAYAIESRDGDLPNTRLTIEHRAGDQWIIRLHSPLSWREALERAGHAPLPPYILRRRREQGDHALDTPDDRSRYQTVYAGPEGAVAAPTAGLHFTDELLDACRARGARTGHVTLHVGAGTFRPVECEFVEQHPIHEEWYSVVASTLALLARTRASQSRVFAVGTTSVRAIESLPNPLPTTETAGATRLLITPGYQWRRVDGLLTNFHLPRSTLLALVAALVGVDSLIAAYREAIARGYRFYSYGDCMLILP